MEYLQIGYVLKPQGIKGELKIMPLSDDMNRYKDLKYVYLKKDNDYIRVDLIKERVNDQFVYFMLDGIDDRNKAEILKNEYIYIDREHAIKLPEHTYFLSDIIDCSIFDTKGNNMGIVTDIMKTGSNDVYVVKNNDNEILIPAIKSVIKQVVISEKKIIVDSDMLEEVIVYDED